MANIFLISDTHFGHAATLNFEVPDFANPGAVKHMRPFANVEEMDDHIVAQWNSVVRPQDKVYHLGDVAMKKVNIATVKRCNGHKRLVRGNHDIFPTKLYLECFEEVYGVRVFEDMILSHIPLHPESVKPNWANVHGHVHCNVPPLHFGPRYLNVSVEAVFYTPVALEDARRILRERQGR